MTRKEEDWEKCLRFIFFDIFHSVITQISIIFHRVITQINNIFHRVITQISNIFGGTLQGSKECAFVSKGLAKKY